LLLIPYLLWGVYLLRQRLTRRVELSVRIEALTLALLAIFLVLELALLKAWLGKTPLNLILASLGLIVSGMALYGPVAVSFASHVLVDMIMPSGHWSEHEPQYGGAEALENQSDFEGAAREYMALARMFPREAKAALRAGDNLMKLGRTEQAVEWFERGIELLPSAQERLPVTNRLFEIYYRRLDRPGDARRVLKAYLERYPDAEYAGSVECRLKRLNQEQASAKKGEVGRDGGV
jgi:tetratricopeptide (TPR) repeat protein